MTYGLPEQPFRFPRPEPPSEAYRAELDRMREVDDWDQEHEDSDPAWRLLGLCLVGAFVIGFWATLAWLILR